MASRQIFKSGKPMGSTFYELHGTSLQFAPGNLFYRKEGHKVFKGCSFTNGDDPNGENARAEFTVHSTNLRAWLNTKDRTVLRAKKSYDADYLVMPTKEISNIIREVTHSLLEMFKQNCVTTRDWTFKDLIDVDGVAKLIVPIQDFSVDKDLGKTKQIQRELRKWAKIIEEEIFKDAAKRPKDVVYFLELLRDENPKDQLFLIKRHALLLTMEERMAFITRAFTDYKHDKENEGYKVTERVKKIEGEISKHLSSKFKHWWDRVPAYSDFDHCMFYPNDCPLDPDEREELRTIQFTGWGLFKFVRNIVIHLFDNEDRRFPRRIRMTRDNLDQMIEAKFQGYISVLYISVLQDSFRKQGLLRLIQADTK